jgi:hypothetical protein
MACELISCLRHGVVPLTFSFEMKNRHSKFLCVQGQLNEKKKMNVICSVVVDNITKKLLVRKKLKNSRW